MNNEIYKVGSYIRLSHDDIDKHYESESIKNQKSIIYQYAKENNFNITKTYIDDGYSGTNFNRPGFKKMISDIENKIINVVITKDMSRLGRDYIETGNLIEKYFPEHNIRYISITDNIDTILDSTNNDIAPFKAIMNDMYAKDISKKIRSSLRAKQKEGKWVGGRAPFGYEKDPSDKNHLIINEEKALVVRRIYDMFLNSKTISSIAEALTRERIRTPSLYLEKGVKKSVVWNYKTVRDILTNRMYIGDMVQSRRIKVNYKLRKVVNNNPLNYVVVENTHEPIIDKKVFYDVQDRLPKNTGRKEKKEHNLLDGLLYCGECTHRISIMPRRKIDNNHYTICNYYRTHRKLCTAHIKNYDKLEKVIIDALKKEIRGKINKNNIYNSVVEKMHISCKKNNLKESKLLYEINNYQNYLDEVYMDKLTKKIDDEQFTRAQTRIKNILEEKRLEYNNILHGNNLFLKENNIVRDYINKFLSMEKISRILILNIVKRIELFDNNKIIIFFHFTRK